MVETKPKLKNNYTSTILKYQLNSKIKHSKAVIALTQNNVPNLEKLAEDIRRTKSMMIIDNDAQGSMKPKAKEFNKFKTAVISPGIQEPPNQEQQKALDQYIVDGSSSGGGSYIDDGGAGGEDAYNNSILISTQIKNSDDLVDTDLINLLNYIGKLSPPTEEEIEKKTVQFNKIFKHKVLIFDLDETLIHSYPYNQDFQVEHDFLITLNNGTKFAVNIRPFVQNCFSILSQLYEIAIFTAAEQQYADLIIDKLDPEKKYISHRLYRQHCIQRDDVYIKDLRIISDREPEDVVIVDNSIISFAFQINQGIPICAFFSGNTADCELLYLITYLETIHHYEDCRVPNIKTFKLQEMKEKYNN